MSTGHLALGYELYARAASDELLGVGYELETQVLSVNLLALSDGL